MLFKWILLTWIFTFTPIAGKQTLVATRYVETSELLIWESSKTFEQARKFCVRHGGSLVKISNITINNAIYDDVRFREEREIWIGASDKIEEDSWKWTDGTNVEFTNWDDGQPDNRDFWGRREDCVTIRKNGKWNDKGCGSELGFVCQKSFNLTTYPPKLKNGAHFYNLYVLYEDWKTFSGALQSCADKDSRLVEVASQEIGDYLKLQMNLLNYGSTFRYWTGGSDLMNTNSWLWNNRTEIAMNWGWRACEPNGPNQHCVTGSSAGLIDQNCNEKFAYVCEQVKVDRSNLVVDDSDTKEIICDIREAYPSASVSWYFRGIEVSFSSSKSSVFQTKAENRATLHTENITIAEEGNYTCGATHTIGNTTYYAGGETTVKVPSQPAISSIKGNACNSSLVISWMPNKRAIGINHRILISNGVDEFTETVKSALGASNVYVSKSLSPSTEYNVTITPCPNECKAEYSVSEQGITGGRPEKVENVKAATNGTERCVITFTSSTKKELKRWITGYQITVWGSIAESALGSSDAEVADDVRTIGLNTTYYYTGEPNRKYTFGVQATTCAGAGPISKSTGVCVTEKKAPYEVPNPTISDGIDKEGKATLTVQIPDQKNGPLSCLFVIVKPEDGTTDKTVNNLEGLQRANASPSASSEYIAVALAVPSLSKEETSVIMGDSRNTSCNIYSISARKRRSTNTTDSGIFLGRNMKLEPQKNYSVYTVSTTPSGGTALFKTSEMQQLGKQEETSATAVTSIIAVIVVLLILVIIAIVFLIWRKRRQTLGKSTENLIESTAPNAQGVPHGAQDEVIYQNTDFDKDEPTRSETEISMPDFEGVYQGMMTNEGAQFMDQFQSILQSVSANIGTTEIASKTEFKKKNRYRNIKPYDSSRVIIQNSETGYINACYVDGFEMKKKFIATQGPLASTVEDFWLMTVEQRCSVIVMLAKCFEAGKKKCTKYWPEHNMSEKYGPVSVTNIQEVRFCGFVRRKLDVSGTLQGKEIKWTVMQYHLLTWPDHGVPLTTSQLMRMHKEVMQTHATLSKDNPIIVHCSAGAGRTGTFVGYDILLNQSKKMKSADFYNCVLKMREQRVDMVQNCDQYILVHKLIIESYLFGESDLTTDEAIEKFQDAKYRTEVAPKQFENLSRVEPVKFSFRNTTEDLSPQGRMKVVLARQEEDVKQPTIDASFVECYDESSRMIAARAPTSKTDVEYFCRAITSENVFVIVNLDSRDKDLIQYFPSDSGGVVKYGHHSVTLQHHDTKEDFETRKLVLTGHDLSISVTHLQLRDGMEDASKIVKLVDEMQKVLREAKNPVALIHCRDGCGSTGTFCAIVNLIERLKVENHVDVFRAVKDLRDCRSGMVETLDQYLFCHQAVIDYLNSFDIYANFR